MLAVQRAALDYLELEPALANSLRERATRRAWLPLLILRAGHERDRGHVARTGTRASSPAPRTTSTTAATTRSDDYSVDVSLTWNFGDAVFNPDEVDVSRELRSVIALRDDVLDEVTQLYFERRRALAQLARLPASDPEAEALRLRSAELAAGIDAWTGGWFSRALRGPATPRNGGSR